MVNPDFWDQPGLPADLNDWIGLRFEMVEDGVVTDRVVVVSINADDVPVVRRLPLEVEQSQ